MANRIDTVVEGGRVVTGGVVAEATLTIDGEIITGILAPGTLLRDADGARHIDARGKIVLPGVIDAHVHFRNFNVQVDSFYTLSLAAAFGGVTTVIPYIQGRTGMSVKGVLEHFREEGEAESLVDFAMHCRPLAPDRGNMRPFDEAFEQGVTSFKMYMTYRKRGLMWDDYCLFEALEYIGRHGGLYCCHAENGDVIDYLEDKYQREGRYTPENYLSVRPPEAEAEAVNRVLTIAGLAQCPLYLVHVSTGRAMALARQARAAGQPVWTETCPQYLTLTQEEMARQGGLTKIAPPLRTAGDLQAVWSAVLDGTVDVVASDHAPLSLADKQLPAERFSEIGFGMPGVETMLSLMYSEGVAKGRLTLPRLVNLLCEGPARVFGLSPRKGSITVGADADLVILDPDAEWSLSSRDMHSQAGYIPYDGWPIRGKPVTTMVRGKVVIDNGNLSASPGHGSFLPRFVSG